MPSEEELKKLEIVEKLASTKPDVVHIEITSDPLGAREIIAELIKQLRGPDGKPSSREVALAVTKLQEARYWLGEAVFGK